jgi:hypothetical protein
LKSGVNEIVIKNKMRRGMSVIYKKGSVLSNNLKRESAIAQYDAMNTKPGRKSSVVSTLTDNSI